MKQDFTIINSSIWHLHILHILSLLFQWLRLALRLRDLTPNAIEKLHKAFVGHLAENSCSEKKTFSKHFGFPNIGGEIPPKWIHFNKLFHYFHHPFWGFPTSFGNIHILQEEKSPSLGLCCTFVASLHLHCRRACLWRGGHYRDSQLCWAETRCFSCRFREGFFGDEKSGFLFRKKHEKKTAWFGGHWIKVLTWPCWMMRVANAPLLWTTPILVGVGLQASNLQNGCEDAMWFNWEECHCRFGISTWNLQAAKRTRGWLRWWIFSSVHTCAWELARLLDTSNNLLII